MCLHVRVLQAQGQSSERVENILVCVIHTRDLLQGARARHVLIVCGNLVGVCVLTVCAYCVCLLCLLTLRAYCVLVSYERQAAPMGAQIMIMK